MSKLLSIKDNLDNLTSYLQTQNPNSDILSIQKYIDLINTNYYSGFYKENEFELYMNLEYQSIYSKIDPTNKWPELQQKYSNLTTTINETLSTDGAKEDTDYEAPSELNEISIKKYITAILTQSSNYANNSVTTEVMNQNLIDDFNKILSIPSSITIMNQSVLKLQPYVYSTQQTFIDPYNGISKWKDTDPTYQTVMRLIDEINDRLDLLDRKISFKH